MPDPSEASPAGAETVGDASHDLDVRLGLPEAYAWLLRDLPRADWPVLKLHAAAQFWLERHAWFRRTQERLADGSRRWRESGAHPLAYARETLPVLGGFLQHLDGHHRIESEHYFPAMALQEPRMKGGFALLDRDHDAIHQVLEELADAGVGLNRALTAAAGEMLAAERLAAVIDRAGRPLTRHLDDEEDIVVPMLTRYGDPFELLEQ